MPDRLIARLRRHLSSIALVTLIVVGTAVAWTEYWLAHQNTLHDSERWQTAKTECRKGVIGGAMSRLTRVMLHRNRLDLGAWFGYQEIYLQDALAVTSVSFSFQLTQDAHVSVLFDRGTDHFDHLSGFRMSRRPDRPSMFLTTGRKRIFERTEAIQLSLDDGWHTASLTFEDATCHLAVDGVALAQAQVEPAALRRIGFRGGAASALLDDVCVKHRLADGREAVLMETFARSDLWAMAASAFFGMTSVLFAACWWVAFRIRRSVRRGLILACAVTMSVGLLGAALMTLDYWWLSARYPKEMLLVPKYENTMFRPEVALTTWPERYPEKADQDRYRILFVGSSQTWGSGASVEADVWTRITEQLLNEQDPEVAYECRNVAVSGAKTTSLLATFRNDWRQRFAPDLTVINLGNNDFDSEEFGRNLVLFAESAREVNSRVAFVLEPNSPENPSPHLATNHVVMRLAAEHCKVPLIDMNAYFADASELGFLWWDLVHMTSAGQQLMAGEMAARLPATMK